jgi:hypothetical protein
LPELEIQPVLDAVLLLPCQTLAWTCPGGNDTQNVCCETPGPTGAFPMGLPTHLSSGERERAYYIGSHNLLAARFKLPAAARLPTPPSS